MSADATQPWRRLRSVAAVAELLGGVSPSLVRKLERAGILPGIRIGTRGRGARLLFDEADVAAYIERCRRGAGRNVVDLASVRGGGR